MAQSQELQLNYTVGCNTVHIPVMIDYLNKWVGQRLFDPPGVLFEFKQVNDYMNAPTVSESLQQGFDFMLANPYRAACVESETNAVTLATQVVPGIVPARTNTTTATFPQARYGAALYTLKERTDIRSVADVRGQVIGTNRITSLATHLCYDLMLRHGVHFLQDPKQTIFYPHSRIALQAVLDRKIDVGCAATGQIETEFMEQGRFDWDETLRVLNPQLHHTLDDDAGRDWAGTPFPHVASTPLVSGYPLQAFPHVPTSVQLAVQEAVLQMQHHAQMAPTLLACLESRACLRNNTACLHDCWDAIIIILEEEDACPTVLTTPEQALDAYLALQESELVGFTKPISILNLRNIQENTGFLIKPPLVVSPTALIEDPAAVVDGDSANNGRCVRFQSIVDAVTCPTGHFARTSEEIQNQCNQTGLDCYGNECICQPCVEAFEVDVFTMPLLLDDGDGRQDNDGNEAQATTATSFMLPSSTTTTLGLGCEKFAVCGRIPQEHVLRIYAIDNVGRPRATVTGVFLTSGEDGEEEEEEGEEVPFTFERTALNNHTDMFHFDYEATNTRVGPKIIKILINGHEIPQSPYRFWIIQRDCAEDTGNDRLVADEFGECVCEMGTVEIGENNCVPLVILLPSILVPALVLLVIAVHCYVNYKQQQSDAIWKIHPEELKFDDNPRVLGRGTFGVVLLSEYRGTRVAVKRVVQSSTKKSSRTGALTDAQGRRSLSTIFESQSYHYSPDLSPPSWLESSLDSSLGIGSFMKSFTQTIMARKIGTNKNYSRTTQQELKREIRLLSKLRHPCIATIMGAVLEGEARESMMVMEYMHFGSLHDLLHNQSVTLGGRFLIDMLMDVASGLRFLHSSKPPVIHGDLKAKNILVDNKFRAKVADFGLARNKGCFGLATGTPLWMAPELIRGVSKNTAESDVYSFGMVLYEVFSRKDPYAGEHHEDLLRLIASKTIVKRPPIPRHCPSEVASLMTECWDGEPSSRPKAADLDIRLRTMDHTESDDDAAAESFSSLGNLMTRPQHQNLTTVLTNNEGGDNNDHRFPPHVAQAIKEGCKLEPETHDEVTIVVCNIVSFAEFASTMSPTKVSDLLDRLHSRFDELCERLNVFKVETTGKNAYMAVTNLENSNSLQHASLAARFAIEALHLASGVPIDTEDTSKGFVRIRLGLSTGPVVGVVTHVVGARSRYSLIGDTVNTAALMETHSEPGCIHCSQECYQVLNSSSAPTEDAHETEKDEWFHVARRGYIKRKGNEMQTYWIKPNRNYHRYLQDNSEIYPTTSA